MKRPTLCWVLRRGCRCRTAFLETGLAGSRMESQWKETGMWHVGGGFRFDSADRYRSISVAVSVLRDRLAQASFLLLSMAVGGRHRPKSDMATICSSAFLSGLSQVDSRLGYTEDIVIPIFPHETPLSRSS
jgi:hypothetical protein